MVRRNDELIVTGKPDAWERVLNRAGHEVPGLNRKRTVDLTNGARTLKVGLIGSGKEARQLQEQLATWSKAEHAAVAAELNGPVLLPAAKVKQSRGWSVNPWEWGDDPWEWGDDPWEWGDDPWEWGDDPALPMVVPAGATQAEGEALFWQQGAFRKIGLTDANGQRVAALADRQGEGVLAAVFDALPARPVNFSWLTLHPSRVAGEQPRAGVDLSDHGLMCASLIHAVAPKAQVHLYEACGKDGEGRLFPLVEAISDFITLAQGRPAVISLSLGSQYSRGSAALRAVLQKATDAGMVVCAAAGNGAYGTPKVSALLQAQVPATFPNVVAISASNQADQRALYSQRGDLAAPGGEALGQPGPDDAEDMIGMGVSVGTSGYVRMDAGTSFATPLVAGAAALLLETQSNRDAQTYARVLEAMKAGAAQAAPTTGECLTSSGLGAGILNLPALF
ncbi:MAG TPA: S8 family serine peptidase [Symbiobacteriaceae bacterium]|nr:S8 family serine peptidase [Symbiobacteriaceae bacterium]